MPNPHLDDSDPLKDFGIKKFIDNVVLETGGYC